MDWRIKCATFHALRLPGGPIAHRWLQRTVTKRYFMPLTDERLRIYSYHLQHFRGGRALEFGAGADLLAALLISNAGASRIDTFDLTRLATVEQVNHSIRALRGKVSGIWPEVSNLGGELERLYRICYHAPADVRATGLPDGSIDFVYSTSTLEHIGERDIEKILAECVRVSSPGVRMSFVIDYQDHYVAGDSRIGRFNFYRYSANRWRLYNPANHFQNRLRHGDFEAIFRRLGLECVENVSDVGDESDITTPLAPCFQRYSRQDLVTRNGFFVLHQSSR